MQFKKYLSGSVAVLAADMAAGYLPGAIDVAGLPVRKAVAAAGGSYASHYLLGGEKGIMKALINGIGALAAAEVATRFVPLSLSLGPIDAVRLAAGAVGSWGVDKIT